METGLESESYKNGDQRRPGPLGLEKDFRYVTLAVSFKTTCGAAWDYSLVHGVMCPVDIQLLLVLITHAWRCGQVELPTDMIYPPTDRL